MHLWHWPQFGVLSENMANSLSVLDQGCPCCPSFPKCLHVSTSARIVTVFDFISNQAVYLKGPFILCKCSFQFSHHYLGYFTCWRNPNICSDFFSDHNRAPALNKASYAMICPKIVSICPYQAASRSHS